MLAKSPAAAVNASGAAVTNDIRGSYRDLDRYPVFHSVLARAIASNSSGAAITNDISHLGTPHDHAAIARPSPMTRW
jgi:hypothetical protein